MIYIILNALPILAATLAGLAFGAGYYRLVDRSPNAASRSLTVVAFAAEFWFASILAGALILAPPEAGKWVMAIGTAVVIWIGFVVPALLVTLRYRGLSARAVLADCGHWLGVVIVHAAVLQSIGLQPPPA
jgi:hypothetical protein